MRRHTETIQGDAANRLRAGSQEHVWLKFINFEIGEISWKRSRPGLAFDKPLKYGSQLDFSFSRASLPALEFNPAFVKAVEHLNAGCGVLHALR